MGIKKILEAIDFIKVGEAAQYAAENKLEILDEYNKGNISEVLFFNSMSLLTPQSRSSLFEKALIYKLEGIKNKASDNIGDTKIKGIDYEIKISGLNIDKSLHLVQVRLWQNTNYLVQYIDVDNNFESIYFSLTHDEMVEEIKAIGASAAHGTKESNKENKNIEHRFTLVKGTVHFDRWLAKYQIKIVNKTIVKQ